MHESYLGCYYTLFLPIVNGGFGANFGEVVILAACINWYFLGTVKALGIWRIGSLVGLMWI